MTYPPPLIGDDCAFLDHLRDCLRSQTEADQLFARCSFPSQFWGFALTLYQPGQSRLMVVRVQAEPAIENIRRVIDRARQHPRYRQFDLANLASCRMQVDFIVDPPQPVTLAELSESALPDDSPRPPIPNDSSGVDSRQVLVVSTLPAVRSTRFEVGVDGLRIVAANKRRYFLPGDAFVWSILGLGQLRQHVQRLFPGESIGALTYYRFRSLSYISAADGWTPLYRGYPLNSCGVGCACRESEEHRYDREANAGTHSVPYGEDAGAMPQGTETAGCEPALRERLQHAAKAGVRWLLENQFDNGQFVYYYDAATDTRRDHEHPSRDPETNPYYNLLRHGGAVLTLLFHEKLRRQQELSPRTACSTDDPCRLRKAIEAGCDFFVQQLVEYQTPDGKRAAYAYFNRKAKLGGSGIGLYMLSLYQKLFDDRYAESAELVANHIASDIQSSGEFMYYHVYLDRKVTPDRNRELFSFYYPGEAIIGLANHCQHVRDADALVLPRARIHSALRFLLVDRPRLYQQHYQSLPSDSWLMMGINDLWDEPEFRRELYQKFVFTDADAMVAHQYTEEDALYPDYVGSFYYEYGDHAYPDGARAEGLLAAYELALKVKDEPRIIRYRSAIESIARSTLQLCNTADSVYSAPNSQRSMGGIRFKLTRQWFRIDTIQHVASFYLKLLSIPT